MKLNSSTATRSVQPSVAQLADGLIISVGEARKILGTDAAALSDDELIAEIHALDEIARSLRNISLSSDKTLL